MPDDKPKPASPWPLIVQMLIGIALVAGGAWYAHQVQLAQHLRLDWVGTRVQGTAAAETTKRAMYRLSYKHPNGTIYSSTRTGHTKDSTDVALVYDPESPNTFQPAGVSYIPAAFVFVTALIGLAFVAQGNRKLQKMYRRPRTLNNTRPGS